MTDYWKSNERKYCDFCKCWISDNKASIAFHENGKRHKLSVAKRITDISRSSEKSEREKRKVDAEIRKMEEAAMRSYAHDIHARGDMTAHSLGAMQAAVAARQADGVAGASVSMRQVDPLRLPGSDDESNGPNFSSNQKEDHQTVPNPSLWVEGKSDDGHTYYWNVKSNESVWEAPKEGFMTWVEYQKLNDLALKQQEIQQAAEAKKFRENVNEEVARYNRERLKVFRPKETAQEKRDEEKRKEQFKTAEEASATTIGSWQTVNIKPPEPQIDWELPKVDNYYIPPVVSELPPEPPVKRFKEKTIEALDPELASGTSTSFKKRKFAAKGNPRQRLHED